VRVSAVLAGHHRLSRKPCFWFAMTMRFHPPPPPFLPSDALSGHAMVAIKESGYAARTLVPKITRDTPAHLSDSLHNSAG